MNAQMLYGLRYKTYSMDKSRVLPCNVIYYIPLKTTNDRQLFFVSLFRLTADRQFALWARGHQGVCGDLHGNAYNRPNQKITMDDGTPCRSAEISIAPENSLPVSWLINFLLVQYHISQSDGAKKPQI